MRIPRVRVGGLRRRRLWRAYVHRRTGSAWTDSRFRMSVGSRMGSTNRSKTSMWYHAIPVSCAGGLLLFIIDQRGSCGSLDTRRPFLLLLSIHGCRMMIYMTGGCTTRVISFQQVRCVLCQWLHGLVLSHLASFHDTRPRIRSFARWSCPATPSRPSGPIDGYPPRAGARSTVDIYEARCRWA